MKNLPANGGGAGDSGLIPGPERFPWRRAWQPTPVFMPGNSHGQRSLVNCSPWGHKESDMNEQVGLLGRLNESTQALE